MQTEYNSIVYNDNNNNGNNDYYQEEESINEVYDEYENCTCVKKQSIFIKYLYYLLVMIIAVIIEIYLLSKFLPTIMKNINIEDMMEYQIV